MGARRSVRSPSSIWIAISAITILTVSVGWLSLLAYDRSTSVTAGGIAAPVPSFSLGVKTATPTPTTAAAAPIFDRSTERFLSVGPAAMWRATAGECGGASPTIERSVDGGTTWRNVTPTYLGVAQIASLDVFQSTQAEAVVGTSASCETAAMRTYTQGQFWDSYPAVLAASRYIDPIDPRTVHLSGDVVAAPCGSGAHGLRADGSTVALICDGIAYAPVGGTWTPLPETDVAAVAVDDGAIYTAAKAEGCDGLVLAVHATPEVTASPSLGCIPTDSPGSVALAIGDGGVYLWSGAEVVRVPGE